MINPNTKSVKIDEVTHARLTSMLYYLTLKYPYKRFTKKALMDNAIEHYFKMIKEKIEN